MERDLIVHRSLLDERQGRDDPRECVPTATRLAGIRAIAGIIVPRESFVHIVIVVQSKAQLFQVVGALGSPSSLARGLNRR